MPRKGEHYFPTNKYDFHLYFRKKGDWVWTFPMSREDIFRWKDGLVKWCSMKRWRCTTEVPPEPNGEYSCIGTLIAKHPNREYT